MEVSHIPRGTPRGSRQFFGFLATQQQMPDFRVLTRKTSCNHCSEGEEP